ncbi:MAG: nuclear transport factor 2 family protein [Acidimicrobiales bacterium]
MTVAREALTALNLEYADAVRARDPERWGATWADDAVWELGPDRHVTGRDAIVELWSRAIAKYDRVVQLYLSTVFAIDDEAGRATGRVELLELNRTADGAAHSMAGHYLDGYVRTPDGWRFASRRLEKYYAGPPDLSGLFAGD